MSQVINTNVMSLNSQRNLATSGSQLAVSLQRLSSGLRINSAKDDAAGLAISERFTTQIRGLNQAVRNANDGISLAQTGEGALQELANNLQRIRELAVQSANATNSASDREALDAEVQQRLAEVDRIANQTSFNGQKILNGDFGSAVFQVGANVGETISLSLSTSMQTDAIGSVHSVTSTGDLAVNDQGVFGADNTDTPPDFVAAPLELDEGDLAIEVGGETINVAAGSYESASDLVDAINTAFGSHGSAVIVETDTGMGLSFIGTSEFEITGDAATTLGIAATSTEDGDLTQVNVNTVGAANEAIARVDSALTAVSSLRSDFGAIQNRFESVIANLSTAVENMSASRSRIMDADFAAETANLTRAQVLQQAGVAMLAQANAMPQNVLSLLR